MGRTCKSVKQLADAFIDLELSWGQRVEVYTLDVFKTKGGEKREVTVPAYVHDIVKVQVYGASRR